MKVRHTTVGCGVVRRGAGRGALATLLTAVACGLLAACGVPASTSGTSQLRLAPVKAAVAELPASIRTSGVLVTAMALTAPPGSYFPMGSQTLAGLDPSIAHLLADALGLKLQMQNVSFDAIIPGMAAGRYPITISEMSPEPAREKVLNFVDYAQTGDALAVPAGNPNHINISNLCGLTVGALAGGYQITQVLPAVNKKCIEDRKPEIQFKLYPDENSPILALSSSRIDAVYEDSTVLDYAAARDPDIEVQVNRNYGPVAVGIGKSTGLLPAIQTAMSAIVKSPQYHTLLNNLGLASVTITDAKVNDNG